MLRRNLFKLALPDDAFKSVYANLHKLVQKRNGIGHGVDKDSFDLKEYEDVRDSSFVLMRELQGVVFSSIAQGLYAHRRAV